MPRHDNVTEDVKKQLKRLMKMNDRQGYQPNFRVPDALLEVRKRNRFPELDAYYRRTQPNKTKISQMVQANKLQRERADRRANRRGQQMAILRQQLAAAAAAPAAAAPAAAAAAQPGPPTVVVQGDFHGGIHAGGNNGAVDSSPMYNHSVHTTNNNNNNNNSTTSGSAPRDLGEFGGLNGALVQRPNKIAFAKTIAQVAKRLVIDNMKRPEKKLAMLTKLKGTASAMGGVVEERVFKLLPADGNVPNELLSWFLPMIIAVLWVHMGVADRSAMFLAPRGDIFPIVLLDDVKDELVKLEVEGAHQMRKHEAVSALFNVLAQEIWHQHPDQWFG